MANEDLKTAKKNKADEFYTQLSDIEKEMKFYKAHFEGKVVFCNCDDPYESNFFKYFALNFNRLKLKKLISVSYANSPVAGEEMGLFEDQGKEYKITGKKAYKVVMSEFKDITGDGRENLDDVREIIKHRIRYLKGDGDFRSDESIEMLKEADIIVTNPPFSLFREYVAQLVEYNKQFVILGNQNAITYKEFFPLIKDEKVWLGPSIHNGDREFRVPESYNVSKNYRYDDKGYKYVRVRGPRWFTNLDYKERHENLDLYKEYTPEEYPKYDNYDAIEVSKTSEIPYNYFDIMGVPITFLDKYSPEQFEILGITDRQNTSGLRTKKYTIDESPKFNDLNARSVLKTGDTYKAVYARILIRRKKD